MTFVVEARDSHTSEMEEGGFDPVDHTSIEMNEDMIPSDDYPSEDLSSIDVTQNDPGFSGGSQQETSFITPEESRWIESIQK